MDAKAQLEKILTAEVKAGAPFMRRRISLEILRSYNAGHVMVSGYGFCPRTTPRNNALHR